MRHNIMAGLLGHIGAEDREFLESAEGREWVKNGCPTPDPRTWEDVISESPQKDSTIFVEWLKKEIEYCGTESDEFLKAARRLVEVHDKDTKLDIAHYEIYIKISVEAAGRQAIYERVLRKYREMVK
jgi:hypothetical protein